jgi:hypothetical protein
MAKGIKGSTPTDMNKPARTTFISTYERMEKMRYIAFMEKRDMTSIINEAIDKIIVKNEKQYSGSFQALSLPKLRHSS